MVGVLCDRLYEDHGVICDVDREVENRVVDFRIPHRMSRREVLEKLAHDARLQLRIRFCGTNASLLWGAAPVFTHLDEAP